MKLSISLHGMVVLMILMSSIWELLETVKEPRPTAGACTLLLTEESVKITKTGYPLIPARAGVIPGCCLLNRNLITIPRAGGGDPYIVDHIEELPN